MANEVLEKILGCPSLPSLPSVAVQLLDMTKDPDAKVGDISMLVQQDQGLAAKVLKTVNSSYYGLAKPCGSIERAVMYLGLNTVKSLVLGFSLVETTGSVGEDSVFDLKVHWRTSLHGAVAARELAVITNVAEPDDAFTGGLFQDVGMLAMFVALEHEYEDVLQESGPRRSNLCLIEQQRLGLTHPEAGAALAGKWSLPSEIVNAIAMHHEGDKAVGREAALARIVALGCIAAEALATGASPVKTREFADKAREWFKITGDISPILESIASGTTMLAKLFNVDVGEEPNIRVIMSQASDRAFELQMETQRQADEMAEKASTDGLTNISNRAEFDRLLGEAYAETQSGGAALSVIFMDADKFKNVNDTHGHAAGDAVLIELARRVKETVSDRGRVCRYGGEEFAVVLPGVGIEQSKDIGEEIRSAIEAAPFDLTAVEDTPDELPVTISVGVSAMDAADPARVRSAEKLVLEADEAVYAAKKAGRNRVKVFGRLRDIDEAAAAVAPAETNEAPIEPVRNRDVAVPSEGGAPLILLFEDDALAATLLKTVLSKGGKARVEWLSTGSRAAKRLEQIASGALPAPDLIIADLNLPGVPGIDLLRTARAAPAIAETPFVIMTASSEAEDQRLCKEAGATEYVRKVDLCAGLPKWVETLLTAARGGAMQAA